MKKLTTAAFVLFLLSLPFVAFGQQNPGGGNVVNPIPIDGGVGWLAAAGVAYGVKKWKDARKGIADSEE